MADACFVADSEPWRDESRRRAKLDVISRLRERTSRVSDPGILMEVPSKQGLDGKRGTPAETDRRASLRIALRAFSLSVSALIGRNRTPATLLPRNVVRSRRTFVPGRRGETRRDVIGERAVYGSNEEVNCACIIRGRSPRDCY